MQTRASATSLRAASLRLAPCPFAKPRYVQAQRPSQALRATVKDAECGAEFQLAQNFWDGETMRCLGAATRNKKILIVNVQVYSGALYVEADKCSKELGIRARGGFFENDQDFMSAVMEGAFNKVLIIRLLRDVDGPMFSDALDKYLRPRMTLAGELDKLEEFSSLFTQKKLTNGTEVVLFNNVVGDLEVLVAPVAATSYSSAKPELRIRSAALCRNLFEIFLGSEPVIASAIGVWAAGAKNLLEYDAVKRDTRKA